MSNTTDNPIPKGPPDLCFETSAFTKESFSVDQFLQDHRNKANLETMRDDLGIYLKVLRSAMIELINKDYADFVNLSSNLIGLDKAISSIQTPLGQLREELLQVRQSLDEAMGEVQTQLKQKKELRDQKRSLRSLTRVQVSLKKLKNLLAPVEEGQNLEILILERAIAEFNQLQFHVSHCHKQLTKDDEEMFTSVQTLLVDSIDRLFIESLSSGEKGKSNLACSLSFYLMLGKKEEAERLYRKAIVTASMNPLINEETLRSLPRGLPGLYSKIIMFVDKDMKYLREVTADSERFPGIDTYDFLVRSFWPEVEENLKVNLTSIYAAGDPDTFFQRYCETLTFIEELSERCQTPQSKIELHNHPSFTSFMDRWNLPVYFQIRFQEIVRTVETAFVIEVWESGSNDWKLLATEAVWKCMNRCWENGVFLLPIAHKFWKLSLQIISRFYTWISQVLSKKMLPKSENSLDFLVYLHSDLQNFINKLPEFEKFSVGKLPGISNKTATQLHQSLEESRSQLKVLLEDVNSSLVQNLNGDSNTILRQVSDIPRLFRRTNRESPTKPCAYVTTLLEGPIHFYKKHQDNPQMKTWLQTLFSDVTKQYYSSVGEVLTSVQKTEESLRRLKKARDRSSNVTPPNDRRAGDDDKIRLQLLLDVQAYVQGVQELGINTSSVEKLSDLLLLVETTQKV